MTGLWSHPDGKLAPFSFVSSQRWPPFRIHVKASFSATGNYAFARWCRSNFVSVGHDGKEMSEPERRRERGRRRWERGEWKWKKNWRAKKKKKKNGRKSGAERGGVLVNVWGPSFRRNHVNGLSSSCNARRVVDIIRYYGADRVTLWLSRKEPKVCPLLILSRRL